MALEESMIALHGVRLIGQGPGHIHIKGRNVAAIVPPDPDALKPRGTELHFSDDIAFPGLINSHDHLDFNLFPRLGNRTYANCVEWSTEIHTSNRKTIDAVLKIPKGLRTQWGLYKNLLNGVTTVVNHGEHLRVNNPVIEVYQRCNVLHSVQQEKHWKLKLNNPFAGKEPFVVHTGEGIDAESSRDVNTLIRWNLFRRKLIAVHGVAMTEEQASAFAALVWCPDSNFFLLGRTADIRRLQEKTTIVFGTDSTLTAGWNLWEQLRLARKMGVMPDSVLYGSVTHTPAGVWQLPGRGVLRKGGLANVVVARRASSDGDDLAAWFEINPRDILLVVQDGRVRLCDETRYGQLKEQRFHVDSFSRVVLQGETKYVEPNISRLMREIKTYAPDIELPLESLTNGL